MQKNSTYCFGLMQKFLPYPPERKGLIWKLMKLSLVQITLGMILSGVVTAHDNYAQEVLNREVSLNLKEVTLKKTLSELETATKVKFVYSRSRLKLNEKVSLDARGRKLGEILEELFVPRDIQYSVQEGNDYIVLTQHKHSGDAAPAEESPANMGSGFATITGTVRASAQQPLPGVNVIVKGTTNGTTTDSDGRYSLSVSEEDAVLVFSFIGYISQEIPINGRSVIDITMAEDVQSLGEVVVIGYGEMKESDLTGSVSSLKADGIKGLAVTGFDQAMQGRMAGVQVTQNSGEPGGSVSLRIRGVGSINSTNEPLYIVDGVPYGSLNAINPNDIDRIDVLKDASSAAIYGSRASNGVVLVTTKRGKSGKLTVTADAYAGIQNVFRKMSLLNGPQFAKLANENLVNGGQEPNPAWSNPTTVQSNDWQSAVFQTAPIHSYNVSISDGGERSSTLFSFGYFEQGGIIVASNYKRYTARLNTDYTIAKNFKVGITLNAAFNEKDAVGSQNDYSGVLSVANRMQPTSPIKTSQNGLFGLNPDGSINPNDNTYFGWEGYAFTAKYANIGRYPSGINNPVHTVKYYVRNPQKTQQLLGAFFAEYELVQGLKLRSTINLSFGNSFNISSGRKAPPEINIIGQYRSLSNYTEVWNKTNQWNWINTISYDKNIGQHNFNIIGGIDALENNYRFANITTSNVPDLQQVINASDNKSRVVTGYPTDFALLSYFGRISYDYEGKYLLSASIRRDGSSKFGPNNKYGVFPSASVGWRISEEQFMKTITFINELKLRSSYGTVGNQNIPNFKYLTTYTNDGGRYQYTIGDEESAVNAAYADNIGDPNIRWEKSTQINMGMDVSFLQGKFTLTTDYYIKELDDLLGNFPVPTYTGVYGGSVLKNGFSMKNSGLEISVGYNQRVGEVDFSANGNFSTLDNSITKLTENKKGYVAESISVASQDGGAQTRTKVGERIGTFYGYVTNGIIQNADEVAASGLGGVALGDRLYKDLNEDGIINGDDKTALGNGLPEYIFGMNLRANYRRFDISVLLNGQAGVQIANMTRFGLYNMRYHNSTGIVNVSSDLLNSWSGPGTSSELPRNAYTAPPSNQWFSSFYIENGAFVRIRNVQIGYTLPEVIYKKAGISHARIYIAGQNLHTFTDYTGYDPEIGSPNQNVLTTGTDFGRYPLPRMIMAGINCQF